MRPYVQLSTGVPFADFNYAANEPIAGENATFNASASYDLNGNIFNYAWDFGDGATTTSASPVATHAYPNAGTYTAKLIITDNDGLTDTKTYTITVKKISSNVAVSTSSSSMFAGFKVNVMGALTDMYGNVLKDKTVVLSYTFSGITTWTPITSCTTDNAGNYLATWIPTATGSFTLNASWNGDANHFPTNSTTTLTCLSYDQYVFSVESNSTIAGLSFNATGQTLSFTATGPDGTKGYARATVARNLTANPTNIPVLLDGNKIESTSTSASDSCSIYFTYQHSTHTVIIDLSATAQPTSTPTSTTNPSSTTQPDENLFTNWMLILIPAVIAILVIALILALKRKTPQIPNSRKPSSRPPVVIYIQKREAVGCGFLVEIFNIRA